MSIIKFPPWRWHQCEVPLKTMMMMSALHNLFLSHTRSHKFSFNVVKSNISPKSDDNTSGTLITGSSGKNDETGYQGWMAGYMWTTCSSSLHKFLQRYFLMGSHRVHPLNHPLLALQISQFTMYRLLGAAYIYHCAMMVRCDLRKYDASLKGCVLQIFWVYYAYYPLRHRYRTDLDGTKMKEE